MGKPHSHDFTPYQAFRSFIQIPMPILRHPGLNSTDKLVWGYLAKCYGKNGPCFVSHARAGSDLNLAADTIKRSTYKLRKNGLIDIVSQTGGTNLYIFPRHPCYDGELKEGIDARPREYNTHPRANTPTPRRDSLPTPQGEFAPPPRAYNPYKKNQKKEQRKELAAVHFFPEGTKEKMAVTPNSAQDGHTMSDDERRERMARHLEHLRHRLAGNTGG